MGNHNHGPSIPHGTKSEYIWGLLWSLVLTAISFGTVMYGDFDRNTNLIILAVAGVSQILAQLVFFLHMKRTSDQSWNVVTGVFTVIQVLILVLGTVWVMMHLHMNMVIGF